MDAYSYEMLLRYGITEERIKGKDLSEVDLSHRELVGIDLRGFTTTKANLEYTNLTGAILRGMTFASANCVSTCFIGADLRGVNLAFGYFHNADFRGADLRGARIADAVCNESNFCGADLRGALFGSEHYDSDFRSADLRGADFPEGCDFERLNCDVRGAAFSPEKTDLTKNKRDLKRIQILPHVKIFDVHTSNQAGILLDITARGIKLSSEYPYTVGGIFSFKFTLPEQSEAIDFAAKCMWCNPEANTKPFYSGFQIQEISEKNGQILNNFIASYDKKGIEISDS